MNGIELEPTIAMRRGEAWIDQCVNCGLLAAVPSTATVKALGPCPACGGVEWSRQTLPVGPFRGGATTEQSA